MKFSIMVNYGARVDEYRVPSSLLSGLQNRGASERKSAVAVSGGGI